jgi:hypothetical protein
LRSRITIIPSMSTGHPLNVEDLFDRRQCRYFSIQAGGCRWNALIGRFALSRHCPPTSPQMSERSACELELWRICCDCRTGSASSKYPPDSAERTAHRIEIIADSNNQVPVKVRRHGV